MVSPFNNAESVIQFSDKKEGTIIGKYLLLGNTSYSNLIGKIDTRIYAKITIQVKENKARIIVVPTNDINVYNEGGRTKINNKINSIITNFETKIKINTITDW